VNNINNPKYLLSFSIGPVQDFISSARTVRDLWSGSYILSWLTAKAISLVIKEPQNVKLIYLDKPEEHPLIKLILKGEGKGKPEILIPCLPNYFIAEVKDSNDDEIRELQKKIDKAVCKEWLKIAREVKKKLNEMWTPENLKENHLWDKEWKTQIRSYWDIRTAAIPFDKNALYSPLVKDMEFKKEDMDEDKTFKANKNILGLLDAAKKNIRHYPKHENSEETRPKCSLCGVYSQMGPRAKGKDYEQMILSREFWEKAVKLLDIPWERIQTKDRFCAIHLVKRFAWSAYLSGATGHPPSERRVWDTATIAAMDWMDKIKDIKKEKNLLHEIAEEKLMDPERLKDPKAEKCHWSGHWLHWKTPDEGADQEGGEPVCPTEVWTLIEDYRKTARENKLSYFPPSYYAILAIDGDKMGERFSNAGRKHGIELGTNLIKFATVKVKDIIEGENLGTLVYCGGDDVLALAPTATILKCAKKIHDDLLDKDPLEKDPKKKLTSSGGIAIAHYKYDLREALEAARKAEKKAKDSGRDCLGLTILRRSGTHTTAVLPWKAVNVLQKLIKAFQNNKTDRWSYQLRREWDMIVGEDFKDPKNQENIPPQLHEIIDAEMRRLIERSDKPPKKAFKLYQILVCRIENQMKKEKDNSTIISLKARDDALTLIQSASFLARGKE
jgi:CRISPR-associated protein Cmr2